ncbi:MAG: hypothetical protein EPN20_01745, partial [Magnetospirillum sp.]
GDTGPLRGRLAERRQRAGAGPRKSSAGHAAAGAAIAGTLRQRLAGAPPPPGRTGPPGAGNGRDDAGRRRSGPGSGENPHRCARGPLRRPQRLFAGTARKTLHGVGVIPIVLAN